MNILEDFWSAVAVAGRDPAMAGPYLSGCRLAWAAAHVLGAQGAGISITADAVLRLPWGASDDDSAIVERLQFTTGEGPCLTAHAEQRPVLANQEVIALSWPMFSHQLHRRTPTRSVFAAPLHTVGAFDLYFTEPDGCQGLDITAALSVGQQILTAMVHDQVVSTLDDYSSPRLPSITGRTEVSVAIGMLTVILQLTYTQALSVLRAHAFTTDRFLEEVASDVVAGVLDPHQLIP